MRELEQYKNRAIFSHSCALLSQHGCRLSLAIAVRVRLRSVKRQPLFIIVLSRSHFRNLAWQQEKRTRKPTAVVVGQEQKCANVCSESVCEVQMTFLALI